MPCTPGAEFALPQDLAAEREARWQIQRERLAGSAFYQRHHRDEPLRLPATLEGIAELPFTDKEDLRKDQATYPPFGSYLAASPKSVTRLHRTSGTTPRRSVSARR